MATEQKLLILFILISQRFIFIYKLCFPLPWFTTLALNNYSLSSISNTACGLVQGHELKQSSMWTLKLIDQKFPSTSS